MRLTTGCPEQLAKGFGFCDGTGILLVDSAQRDFLASWAPLTRRLLLFGDRPGLKPDQRFDIPLVFMRRFGLFTRFGTRFGGINGATQCLWRRQLLAADALAARLRPDFARPTPAPMAPAVFPSA